MRILLVADGRSPITKNWIRMLRGNDCEIYLLSTFPHEPIAGVSGQMTIPVGFSMFAGGQVEGGSVKKSSPLRNFISSFRPMFMCMRAVLAPLLLSNPQKRFHAYVRQVEPDIVHALRIPFEGMLASALSDQIPLVISIWGNDLTFHAKASPLMAFQTRKSLARTVGLLADANCDIKLAKEMGLRKGTPTLVAPGNGGLDLKAMQFKSDTSILKKYEIPSNKPLVINPRGFRPGSVHQNIFFESIPLILNEFPDAHFILPGMHGQPLAEKWVRKYGISKNVTLLPYLPQNELWALYVNTRVYTSLSSHDGTPNSFLEALACGCVPVVGDIPSLREWIDNGENGLLVDPTNPEEAAGAIIRALRDQSLRKKAREQNSKLVSSRANRKRVQKQVIEFYKKLVERT